MEILWIAPLRRASRKEQMGNLLRIDVLMYCRVGRGAERPEQEKNFVLLDQFACLLDRLRRTKSVIEAYQFDLSPVDASLRIDLFKVCRVCVTYSGIS